MEKVQWNSINKKQMDLNNRKWQIIHPPQEWCSNPFHTGTAPIKEDNKLRYTEISTFDTEQKFLLFEQIAWAPRLLLLEAEDALPNLTLHRRSSTAPLWELEVCYWLILNGANSSVKTWRHIQSIIARCHVGSKSATQYYCPPCGG